MSKSLCRKVFSVHPDIYGVKILDDEATEICSQYADQPDKALLAKVWENEKLVIVWGLISSFDRIQNGLESFHFAGKDASVFCVPASEKLVVVIMSPKIPAEELGKILSIIRTDAGKGE